MAGERSLRQRWNRIHVTESSSTARPDEPDSNPVAPSTRGTFIESGAVFEGTLRLTGDFRIDTEFRGELATDGSIIVGPLGSVVGDIRAREVVIRGAVVGNVHAPRQLVVESTGKLHGDIETACLEIQKHALFRGHTTMTQPQTIQRVVEDAPPAPSRAAGPLQGGPRPPARRVAESVL